MTPAQEEIQNSKEALRPMELADFGGVFVVILIMTILASIFFPLEMKVGPKKQKIGRND